MKYMDVFNYVNGKISSLNLLGSFQYIVNLVAARLQLVAHLIEASTEPRHIEEAMKAVDEACAELQRFKSLLERSFLESNH